MKKIVLLMTIILIGLFGYGQSKLTRSNGQNTLVDNRLIVPWNFIPPIFEDTTAANLVIGLDSCGALMNTRTPRRSWYRDCTGGTKVWRQYAWYSDIPVIKSDGWFNIVRDGGADTTGATDVSTIIRTAIAAGWRNIFIPKGTFLVSSEIQMHDSVTIKGAGRFSSIIKLTTDINAFKCSYALGGHASTFSDIGFYGDYATGGTTSQRGIMIDSAQAILITNISGNNIGGFVVNISQNGNCCADYITRSAKSNTVTDSYFILNYGGVNFDVRAEYNTIANSTFTQNLYAIQNNGGNNRIIGNTTAKNTYGLYMIGGSNNGHGIASGNTFNHNGTSTTGANIYLSSLTLGFNFSNNTFAESATATAGRFEIVGCSDITWEGGYTVRDTIRVTGCTNIIFSNLRKYTSFSPVWVTVSGEAPTVYNTGKVNNSMSLTDVVNSKQVDITHLNGKVNFTGTSGIKFGFLNSAADSTVDITGGLKVSGGIRFSGLPSTGTYFKSLGVASDGTLFLKDTLASTGGTVTGTGTLNFLPKWSSTNALGNSQIFDDGTNVGIGTSSPTGRLVSKASSTTSGTTDVQFLNSSNANLFDVRNDGYIHVGSGSLNSIIDIVGTGSVSGIYSPGYAPASNELLKFKKYSSGNVQVQMDFTTEGSPKVGIGTTSPTVRLQLNSTTALKVFSIGSATTGSYIEKLFVDSSGKLNLGTTGYQGTINLNRSADGSTVGQLVANSSFFNVIGANGVTIGQSSNGILHTTNGTWMGKGSISNVTPTALVNIAAGTATASTAPLKFTAGAILTTPESGVMETNTNNELYYSTTTTTASRGFVSVDRYTATATSLSASSVHDVIGVTATGQTITLPTAVGILGRVYTIKLTASGTGTVATTSSQTIDGSTTYSLSAQYKYVTVQSDGANWNIIGNN